jgi:peptide/nickel transport system permease protein
VVLSIKELEYVEAAKAIGSSEVRIMLVHILPHTLPPLIVVWTLSAAQMIIAETALSFLGFGVPPPTPSWGSMLSDGRNYISTAWWLATFPGLAIMLTVLSINLIGDYLREVFDPKQRFSGRL